MNRTGGLAAHSPARLLFAYPLPLLALFTAPPAQPREREMKTALSLAFALGLLSSTAMAAPFVLSDAQMDRISAGAGFDVINEVADQKGVAPVTDRDLVNAWGLSSAPGGPLWVANNGTGTSTIYDPATFAKLPLTVTINAPNGAAAPTGMVFAPDPTSFMVTHGGKTGHSVFLFDTENGTIAGWSPSVNLTHAYTVFNGAGKGDVFKGLALDETTDHLFAADFAHNQIDMFDKAFNELQSFTDPTLTGYAPFNVQVLNGKLYVAFAKTQTGSLDEQHGAGFGFVDVFDLSGGGFTRLVSHGALNAPWGLAIAPASFGALAGALLVGNFGDGTIDAYDPTTGAFLGKVTRPGGAPVTIDGLWALRQGADGELVFSSGPQDESHGLVGAITPDTAKASWAFQSHTQMALASPGVAMHFGH
jgi:uncharacterized protein (TIGR03118 family)